MHARPAVDPEFWGTFSVADHRRRRAFVADVLLYDRVAIPVPDGADEVERWRSAKRPRTATKDHRHHHQGGVGDQQ